MTFEQRLDHDGAEVDALIEDHNEVSGDEQYAAPEARKDMMIPLIGFDISGTRAPTKDVAAAWRRRMGDAARPPVRLGQSSPIWNFANDSSEEIAPVPKRKPRRRRASNPDSDADVDATRAYFNEIGRRPLLTAEQEQEAGRRESNVPAGSTPSSRACSEELGYAPRPMQVWAELLKQLGELRGVMSMTAHTLYLNTLPVEALMEHERFREAVDGKLDTHLVTRLSAASGLEQEYVGDLLIAMSIVTVDRDPAPLPPFDRGARPATPRPTATRRTVKPCSRPTPGWCAAPNAG